MNELFYLKKKFYFVLKILKFYVFSESTNFKICDNIDIAAY